MPWFIIEPARKTSPFLAKFPQHVRLNINTNEYWDSARLSGAILRGRFSVAGCASEGEANRCARFYPGHCRTCVEVYNLCRDIYCETG